MRRSGRWLGWGFRGCARMKCLAAIAAVQGAKLELKLGAFARALERRYSPDQPRVPAGTPEGGQWTADRRVVQELPDSFGQVAQVISGFRKHGINQIINRGLSPKSILDALQNPLAIRVRPNGTTQYIGSEATVVLNLGGEVVTAWPK